MEFAKLHGLGNDFLIIPSSGEGELPHLAPLSRSICDRHCGVGADGVIYFRPTLGDAEADFSALIVNSDGSRAEVSGNGLRCLAAYLIWTGKHESRTIRIRTVSGIKSYVLQGRDGAEFVFESNMGKPITDPSLVPVRINRAPAPVLNLPLRVGGEEIGISLCSIGNPHCSTFWPDLDRTPVNRIGPLLENNEIFPERTNVEFIQIVGRHTIRVRFWERGAGMTLASGTGSCAAAVASILNGFAETPITVETLLGSMQVRWIQGEDLFLRGPARFICSGEYESG